MEIKSISRKILFIKPWGKSEEKAIKTRKHGPGTLVDSLFPGKRTRDLTRDENIILMREYYRHSKPAHTESMRKQKAKLYELFFSRYGKTCLCCGESDKRFLSIEHLNNDGAAHRRSLAGRSPDHTIRDLRKRGWPTGYATLCFNCNMGKARMGGACPHVIDRAREALQEIKTIQEDINATASI